MAFEGPLDYIDVATRIVEFREKYPTGSLQQVDVKFIDFGGSSWVVFTAAAYRTPDDERPGLGTAWEPVPGKTSFTRDSELQNAETAAWGRALVATLAVDTKKGIASAEEVRNRQQEAPASPAELTPPAGWRAKLTAVTTLEGLQTLYDTEAIHWYTDEVKLAFKARKAGLG